MRVLLVHNAYGKRSGEEVVVDQQVELLSGAGHDVKVFHRSSEDLRSSKLAQIGAFAAGVWNPRAISEIKALLAQYKPDVVHVHNLYPWISPAALPSIKALGYPVAMTVHNYRLMCPVSYTHLTLPTN